MTAAALVVAVLAAVGLGRAYRVADRKVQRRDKKVASLTAELTLTREACDRQTVKVRHLQEQVVRDLGEVARLSARNAEMRDQLDDATGATREPSLTEEFHAWLASVQVPGTYPEDPR